MNYYNIILSVQEYEILKNLVQVQILDTDRNLLRTTEQLSPDFHRMLLHDKMVYNQLMAKMVTSKPRSTKL